MKKVFAILAVAGFMASCNSGDSAAKPVDSPVVAPAAVDTSAKAMDTTKHAAMDTTKKK